MRSRYSAFATNNTDYINKTMTNEVEIEEADKNLRETTKMASDNEQKENNRSRSAKLRIAEKVEC